jgi:predicted alpha/beta hydrolase
MSLHIVSVHCWKDNVISDNFHVGHKVMACGVGSLQYLRYVSSNPTSSGFAVLCYSLRGAQ